MNLDRAHLQTPAQDGEVLIEPKPDSRDWRAAVDDWNRRYRDHPLPRAVGDRRTIGELRDALSKELAGPAGGLNGLNRPFVATGHQAEFYHPGVWVKNVAIFALAQRWGGGGLNLVVDHDSPRHTTVALPGILEGKPAVQNVSLPVLKPGHALEQAGPLSSQTWQELDAAYLAYQRQAGLLPEAGRLWSLFHQEAEKPAHLDFVTQLMAGRQAVGRCFGIHLPDLRTSVLSRTGVFQDWLADCIGAAETFQAAYNRALADYRRRHGFHGTQRPMPDLGCRGNRLELPFWAYWEGEPRRRLWVERQQDKAILFADDVMLGEIEPHRFLLDPARRRANQRSAGEFQLKTQNSKLKTLALRPRALTLTLFVRLFLSDLFIHGIGGVKYDEIAEQIMREYYGVEPPPSACVSATAWLPAVRAENAETPKRRNAEIPTLPKSPDHPITRSPDSKIGNRQSAIGNQQSALRRAYWNPQELIETSDPAEWQELSAERRALAYKSVSLRQERPREALLRREVYQQIQGLNAGLRSLQADRLERLEREWALAKERARREILAHNREFFFAFLPIEKLQSLKDKLTALF